MPTSSNFRENSPIQRCGSNRAGTGILSVEEVGKVLSAIPEIIADNLSAKLDGVGAACQPLDSKGRTIWIVDAHGYGNRFIVRAEEILTAFLELERAIHEFAVALVW